MCRKACVGFFLSGLVLVSGCGNGADDSIEVPPLPSTAGGEAASPNRPAYDPLSATATLSGRIRLDGTAPEPTPVRMLGDLFCVRNGIGAMSEAVLVSEDAGLANVVVYVRSGHEDLSYPIPPEAEVLDQVGCVYTPHVLTLMVGQDLRILNSDDTFHNVHSEADGTTFFNFAQAVMGAENVERFSAPSMPLRIGCDVHRWMRTYVGVFDHPFHTVSDGSGNFELELPPGRYEVVAWHETYGELVSEVEVIDQETTVLELTFVGDGA